MKRVILLGILLSFAFPRETNEALIKDIKQSLMAPCCWSGTVFDHGHSKMEAEIQTMVEQGKTKEQILNYYVNEYGERILAIPVASGFNLLAWLAPIIIAGVGILVLVLFLRTPKKIPVVVERKKSKIPYDDEIENELRKLD